MSYVWSTEKYSNYSEDFETIEECIKEAKNTGCKAGTVIWIGKTEEARGMFLTLQELTKKQEMLIACTILYYKGINKKSVNKGTFYYGIIILDNNHSREVSFFD